MTSILTKAVFSHHYKKQDLQHNITLSEKMTRQELKSQGASLVPAFLSLGCSEVRQISIRLSLWFETPHTDLYLRLKIKSLSICHGDVVEEEGG